MVTNHVYVKFSYDPLRIDKGLGNFRKSDNNNNNNKNTKTKTTFVALWYPFAGVSNLKISRAHVLDNIIRSCIFYWEGNAPV